MDLKAISTLIAETSAPSDLLKLRDSLRELADRCNEKYRDTPQPYEHTCADCGQAFAILDTPRERRQPDTCIECYEKASGNVSCLRDAKYVYRKG